MGDKTYIDERGYLRFKNSNKLVHRWVAYNQIYKLNRYAYGHFGSLEVHHIDGNKLNNDSSNLKIISKSEHGRLHGQDRKDDNCFIATAAYGTPFANEIDTLREFRDNTLYSNDIGRLMIKFYYKTSPSIANIIAKSDYLKFNVRVLLWPIIKILRGW